jgi:predicted negative regulator of RcsB-dependent stress response
MPQSGPRNCAKAYNPQYSTNLIFGMATHYDLQEQEQLAQIKHFWSRYGNLITWTLIAVLTAVAGWNGWNYWQRQQAIQAAAIMEELDRVAQTQDMDRLQRVWADMQAHGAKTLQAQHAGLMVAQASSQAGQPDLARQALQAVVQNSPDVALVAVARLRLASLELDHNNLDAAAAVLSASFPPEFEALQSDRLGDLHALNGQADNARQAYQTAWRLMSSDVEYRRIIEAKLNALGVNPSDEALNQGGTR